MRLNGSNFNAEMNLQQSGGTGQCSLNCLFIIIVALLFVPLLYAFMCFGGGVALETGFLNGGLDLMLSKLAC